MGNNKYKTLKKNTMIFAIGNMGSSFISFLLLPLFTNYLSAGEYGQIDFFIIGITLLIPIFTMNFTEVIIRFGLDKKYDMKKVISTVIYTVGLIFIINFIIIILLRLLGVNIKNIYFLVYYFVLILYMNY